MSNFNEEVTIKSFKADGETYTFEPGKATTNLTRIMESIDEAKEYGLDKDEFVYEFVARIFTSQKDIQGKVYAFLGQLEFIDRKVAEEKEYIQKSREEMAAIGW